MKLDLAKYSGVQRQLLEPFPTEVISDIDGYSYVDPYHYHARLAEIFPDGYDFEIVEYTVDKELGAIHGRATFRADQADFQCVKTVLFSESFTKASGTDKFIQVDQTFSKAESAALKMLSKALGLGLDLYYKPAKSGSKKGGQSPASNGSASGAQRTNGPAPAAASGSNPNWTGKELVTFGKYSKEPDKVDTWDQIPTDYLKFCVGKKMERPEFKWELDRRNANNVAIGQANGAASAASLLDSEIPF